MYTHRLAGTLLLLVLIGASAVAAMPGQLSTLAAIAGLQAVIAVAAFGANGRSLGLVALIAIVGASFVGLFYLQQGLPPLSDAAELLWRETKNALADQSVRPRAALGDWDEIGALSGPVLAASALSAGVLIGANRHTARDFLDHFATFISIYAGLAIALHLIRPDYALLWRKIAHHNNLVGASPTATRPPSSSDLG